MSKTIALIGHCGPDSSYLRMAVMQASRGARIIGADEREELAKVIEQGVDLLLFNRELGYGFDDEKGVDVIRRLRAEHPQLKMMLVSNYADAQQAAVEAGALPGFGKRELGSPKVVQLLKEALGEK
jgi:two-component system chemotaxis response regulator CheY